MIKLPIIFQYCTQYCSNAPHKSTCAGFYVIRGLIKRGRCAIKTLNPLKEYSNLIEGQKESFVGSTIPNKHISKSIQKGFRNAEFGQ